MNWSAIWALVGSWALLATAVIALVGIVLGALLAWKNVAMRTSAGLVTGMRFGSLGLIIVSTQLDGDPDILGPAMVFALVDMVVCTFVGVEIGRKAQAAAASKGTDA